MTTRTRKAWAVRSTSMRPEDPDHIEYAPTRSKARAAVVATMRECWSCSFADALKTITSLHRAPEHDILLPPRHELAAELEPDLLAVVTHAYGGTGRNAGYRSHYYTSTDDARMLLLVERGLFRQGRVIPNAMGGKEPYAYFVLTKLGREVAAGEKAEYPDA